MEQTGRHVKHRRLRTTTTERPRNIEVSMPVREDIEAEHLELGMAERLDEKRFQVAALNNYYALRFLPFLSRTSHCIICNL